MWCRGKERERERERETSCCSKTAAAKVLAFKTAAAKLYIAHCGLVVVDVVRVCTANPQSFFSFSLSFPLFLLPELHFTVSWPHFFPSLLCASSSVVVARSLARLFSTSVSLVQATGSGRRRPLRFLRLLRQNCPVFSLSPSFVGHCGNSSSKWTHVCSL